jgi:hypothetical protein
MKPLITATCMLALASPALADDVDCPAAFKGATVRAEKSPAGVTLEFRNGDHANVVPMREQLRAVALMIEQHGTERQTESETDAVDFPPVDIDVKDVVLGARVTVRATRLSDISPIRELAFGFAESWKSSSCYAPLVSQRGRR